MVKKLNKTIILLSSMALMTLFAPQISPQQKVGNTNLADSRFDVLNATFFKNIRAGAKGMELNAVFEIRNYTDKDIKLKINAIAFHERDMSQGERRKWVNYPQWRKRDIDKDNKTIVIFDAIPEVKKSDIQGSDQFPESSFVPFHHFVTHLESNTSAGLDLTLRGLGTPRMADVFKDKYTILYEPVKTTLNLKLRTRYSYENTFFNYFGLVITDADSGKVVFTRLFYFDKPFHIR